MGLPVEPALLKPLLAGDRLLPFARFAALCAEQGIHSPKIFAQFLHDAGMVFYRPGLLDDQLVLDQSWALDAVYAVLTRDGGVYATLRGLGGRFTRPLLDALRGRAVLSDLGRLAGDTAL